MPKRAPCSKVGCGLGAEVGQPVGALVHVMPPVRSYVAEPHAYVLRLDGFVIKREKIKIIQDGTAILNSVHTHA